MKPLRYRFPRGVVMTTSAKVALLTTLGVAPWLFFLSPPLWILGLTTPTVTHRAPPGGA